MKFYHIITVGELKQLLKIAVAESLDRRGEINDCSTIILRFRDVPGFSRQLEMVSP
jgi:hypothetical protein